VEGTMKTDYENVAIENMVRLFNEANKIAGLNCEMVYDDEGEVVFINDRRTGESTGCVINLKMNSIEACYRDIIRSINRFIELNRWD
jgi:hypothetical protein